jgi:hypothetical protein
MSQALTTSLREEVWVIVRAAVEEAVAPLVIRQRELEATLEQLTRERAPGALDSRRAESSGSMRAAEDVVAGSAPSPFVRETEPAPFAPVRPLGSPVAVPAHAVSSAVATATFIAPSPVVAITPALPSPVQRLVSSAVANTPVAIAEKPMHPHPNGPRPHHLPAAPPTFDSTESETFDIEGFDGGKRKKRIVAFVVVVMVLLIAGLAVATVLSHS